jgi:hypothetical protein
MTNNKMRTMIANHKKIIFLLSEIKKRDMNNLKIWIIITFVLLSCFVIITSVYIAMSSSCNKTCESFEYKSAYILPALQKSFLNIFNQFTLIVSTTDPKLEFVISNSQIMIKKIQRYIEFQKMELQQTPYLIVFQKDSSKLLYKWDITSGDKPHSFYLSQTIDGKTIYLTIKNNSIQGTTLKSTQFYIGDYSVIQSKK